MYGTEHLKPGGHLEIPCIVWYNSSMTNNTVVTVRVRELRIGRGWTQAELAEKAGLTRAALSRMENGLTGGIDFDTLGKLADALGCHPATLIERGN